MNELKRVPIGRNGHTPRSIQAKTSYQVQIARIKSGDQKYETLTNSGREFNNTTATKKEAKELVHPRGRNKTTSTTENSFSTSKRPAEGGQKAKWSANSSEIGGRCKSRKGCYMLS